MAKTRCVLAVVLLAVLFIQAVSVIASMDEVDQVASDLKDTIDSAKNAAVDSHDNANQTFSAVQDKVNSTIESAKNNHEDVAQTASDIKSKVDSAVDSAKQTKEDTMSWYDWIQFKLGLSDE
ncbi:hypothetical protein Patl1_09154 [Pistacia atlantica]|uniref:Uncharacterized protein n=1 Tax=Pistacia atlantica TaxID=434234 RepID=A0ACC1AJN8_9ROSI|nr:hypothetical protein Patl1_09154 [Pistacia atlantica]